MQRARLSRGSQNPDAKKQVKFQEQKGKGDLEEEYLKNYQRIMENYLNNEEEMHEEMEEKMKCYWRSKQYWKLPENVRNAVDIAHMKQKHS